MRRKNQRFELHATTMSPTVNNRPFLLHLTMVIEAKKFPKLLETLEALQDISKALAEASSAFTKLTDQVRLAERWAIGARSDSQEMLIDDSRTPPCFLIDAETSTHVPTSTAAKLSNRSPQTLRKWACYENGPL